MKTSLRNNLKHSYTWSWLCLLWISLLLEPLFMFCVFITNNWVTSSVWEIESTCLFLTDKCNKYQHEFVRYKVMPGSDCKAYCQCTALRTNRDGSIEYYWQRQNCPSGTIWNGNFPTPVCDFSYKWKCANGRYSIEN